MGIRSSHPKRSLVWISLVLLCLSALPLAAQDKSAQDKPAQDQPVIASTSWVQAYAIAAGARNIVTIAPFELQHPPEYEIKPSDLLAVQHASLIVYSGYEKFAKKLAETAQNSNLRILAVYTDNVPSTIIAESKKIAQAMGTTQAQEQWAKSFTAFSDAMRERIAAALPDKRVVVQAYMKTFALWLGLDVVGTFGPGEPSPAVVLDLIKKKPVMVLDNYHNPGGKALAESLGVPHVLLINFPGKSGTRTIEDVFLYNEKAILGQVGK
jgi:zinc transport system substrate-binding protein/iron/zinc/copper transport system substrate-binding protein